MISTTLGIASAAIATLGIMATATALAGSPAPLTAPEPQPPSTGDTWWVRSNSYGWLTAQEGDLRIGTLTVPVDLDFADAVAGIDELDMGFMGGLEVGRDRWSLGVDLTYVQASDDFAAGGLVFDSFRLEQAQWMINPFVSYALAQGNRWQLDVLAGARINTLEMDVTGRFSQGGQITLGGSREWIDPVVGLRGRWNLTERLSTGFRGDIGGFGVSSSITWQAYVGFGWQTGPRSALAAGYRALGTDYSHGNFGSDTVLHGPLIGLQISF